MSPALKTLKSHLAAMPTGKVNDPSKVAALLSACWDELIGDTRGILALQVPTLAENMKWNPPNLIFDMKWRLRGSSYSDSWSVNTDKGSVASASDADFDALLEKKPARDLIAAKLDPTTLRSWLRFIAEVLSKKYREQARQRAKSLAARCIRLAEEIQQTDSPPVGFGIIDIRRALPDSLATFGHRWPQIYKPRHLSGRVFDSRREEIFSFLRVVKEITGRDHYREIAYLLNAINGIPRYRHPRRVPWNERMLAQMAYRDRERVKAIVADAKIDSK